MSKWVVIIIKDFTEDRSPSNRVELWQMLEVDRVSSRPRSRNWYGVWRRKIS